MTAGAARLGSRNRAACLRLARQVEMLHALRRACQLIRSFQRRGYLPTSSGASWRRATPASSPRCKDCMQRFSIPSTGEGEASMELSRCWSMHVGLPGRVRPARNGPERGGDLAEQSRALTTYELAEQSFA
ncbi:hypothetical protein EJB05_40067, partial [Eragrostis curvula]